MGAFFFAFLGDLLLDSVLTKDASMADILKAESTVIPLRHVPHNMEAEQALLGAILVNNIALNHVMDSLLPEHFYSGVHQRIFAAIKHFHDKGQIADPVTLKHYFEKDEDLADIGGGDYLARLAASAITVIDVSSYSEVVYDLAIKRSLIAIGEEMVNTAYRNEMENPAYQQIETAEQELFSLAASGHTRDGSVHSFSDAMGKALKNAEFAYKNKGQVLGVTSGLTDLDKLLGGLQRSDLVILAGRPSMGKTALATTMAYNAALHFQRVFEAARQNASLTEKPRMPESVGFFSLEMSAEQLANRILASRSEINSTKILRGDMEAGEFSELVRATNELADLPFFIDDTPALSISALRTRARRLQRTRRLGFVVVDYLQLVRGSNTKASDGRVQEVSEVTQGLKAIAKELNVPVLALSQLSRAVEQREDKRPQLSDLRESGSIEQDSDVVMFVYREEYYVSRKKPNEGDPKFNAWQEEMNRCHGLADAIIAKQRHGPIGTVTMAFNSDLTRFSDWERDEHYVPREYE